MGREIAIVLYHHIADGDDRFTKQLGLSTPPEIFEKHIKYFAQNFDFVSGSDLLDKPWPRKPILVTFDDAYRSVLDVAAPILKSVNAPSLFFINPATVTTETLPIDNVLSCAVAELGLGKVLSLLNCANCGLESTVQAIADFVPMMGQVELVEAKRTLCAAIGATEGEMRRGTKLFLDPADVRALGESRIEVGNHSMNHTYFRSLSSAELHKEIAESRTLLETVSGGSVRHLSIPYGNKLDATQSALDAARSSGHQAVFLVHAKSNRFRPAEDIFYRVSLGRTPPSEIALRLRVMPVMRSIRDMIW